MRRGLLAMLASSLLACTLGAAPPAAPERGIGNVHMPISCGAEANARFDRGLALLHSFWYERALTEFDAVIAAHPECAIAYWGAAMTFNHPLWGPPTANEMGQAIAYLERAKRATVHDDRETRYLAAVTVLYGDADPAGAAKDKRDAAYREAMRAILAAFPDDETKLFTSLAIMGVRGASDADRLEAAALAGAVNQKQHDHPGALHYLIHAYDTDALAERGLPAARSYAASAPSVPHALHMPSHIFLRLGLWDEARDSNLASWAASEDAVRRAGEPQSARQFHNLQFGQYASVQLGRYAEAKQQAQIALDQYDDNLKRIAAGGLSQDDVDDLRALDFEAVGMTAQYALSSGDYSLAARLPASYSGPLVAVTALQVRAMAALAADDASAIAAAEKEARALLAKPPQGASAGTLAIVRITANETLAALAHARRDDANAFAAMEAAIADEDARGRHLQPTYPVIPAHELYARFLFEAGNLAPAESHYRTALKLFPNRALPMLGLAKVASARRHDDEAARFAATFATLWSHADPGRPELAAARNLR